MSDLIDRQAAIDSIRECVECADSNCEWELKKGYLNAIECIEEEPSAEPHWIPCSERLPEDDRTKVVTLANGITEAGYYTNGDWWCIGDSITLENPTVIAWMPLPKPYRGEE